MADHEWLRRRIKENAERYHIVRPIFRFLTGDVNWQDWGGKFISQRMRNASGPEGMDFWLVLDFSNTAEWGDYEGPFKYNAEVYVISPGELSEERLEEAIESNGWEDLDRNNPHHIVEACANTGVGKARIWSGMGNNYRKLMKQARDGAYKEIGMFFGFALDKPQNALGSTGWEFLKGDVMAGMFRYTDNDTPAKEIMRKMHGLPRNIEEAEEAEARGEGTLVKAGAAVPPEED